MSRFNLPPGVRPRDLGDEPKPNVCKHCDREEETNGGPFFEDVCPKCQAEIDQENETETQ